MQILIVEDDQTTAKLLQKNIKMWGHQVELATTGKSALQKFVRVDFNLVLLDIFLPDYHGADLIPQFKAIQHTTGIIAMTGHNSRELELKVRELGLFYYLIKPFDMNSLKTILDHVANKKFPNKKNLSQEIEGFNQIEDKGDNPSSDIKI